MLLGRLPLLSILVVILLLISPILTKPLTYATKYAYEPVEMQQQPVYLGDVITEPQRTEALINNTLVAGNMLYRFFRAIYRAGTIVYSYMPSPFG